MKKQLVSVILPTYNRAHLLERTLESVFEQTYRELELIVVDDGSTDDTPAMLEKTTDSRLRVLRLDANRGAALARNEGIAIARGELFAFIDSDDVWYADKLERQIAALAAASDQVGLCVCSREYGRPGERFTVEYRDDELDSGAAVALIASGTGLSTPCWLARREALESVGGFDASLPRMQDYECSLRIAERWRLLLMSDVLVAGDVQPDSLSESADRYTAAIEIIFHKHRQLYECHPGGHSHMTFRAGKYLALEGRRREAIPWFVKALRIRPTNVRALAGAALCATGLFGLFQKIKYSR
jgi:glycosyltransferase involved in cell wall biosynthesis